jgi:hypothetical protein
MTIRDLLLTALDGDRTLADVVSEKHRRANTKCQAVADSLEADDLEHSDRVPKIEEVIHLANPAGLADELETHPTLTFLVALTRTRNSVHLLVSAKAGGASTPHSFRLDFDSECCEYKVYKKTGRVTEVW